MIRSLLGIAPKEEPDGSYSPSKLALKLSTSKISDYEQTQTSTSSADPSAVGGRVKILVIFTEEKNMTMKNGKEFSTGNHPVEALVPMLHLRDAGFDFEIATPTGKPVVFEMWAMPCDDDNVRDLYNLLEERLKSPTPLHSVVENFEANAGSYAAVFIPGGHGAMLGIPDDPKVGAILRLAHEHDLYTISLCHGPGSFLATALDDNSFLYSGYEMAVFPDLVDRITPTIGYLPGQMPWQLEAKLKSLGAKIVNKKADDTCHIDRHLITGASPEAANALGKLAAKTLIGARR